VQEKQLKDLISQAGDNVITSINNDVRPSKDNKTGSGMSNVRYKSV